MCKLTLGKLCDFNNTFLKKGQKSPKENAIIMHFNIITQKIALSRGFEKFFHIFSKKLYKSDFMLLAESCHLYYAISNISGATAIGRKIAGIIFAVFIFVTPSRFVPIRKMISEPVTDI